MAAIRILITPIHDYSRRDIEPETNGLVFLASPGNRVWARSFSDTEAEELGRAEAQAA